MVASRISDPTVRSTSRGGIHPNWLSVLKSGVIAGKEKSIGVGRSTLTPLFSSRDAKLSNSSLARSIVS